MNRSVVSEKGQVTIPKRIRDRLGIKPGQALEFEASEGRLVARKASAEDVVAAVSGILVRDRSVDELVDEMRGAPDVP